LGSIVSVHSYRGGTGKSNITANLALALADAGARVCIVDTDLPSPGVHVLFGLGDQQLTRSLNDALYGQCAIEEAAYHVTPPGLVDANGRIYLVPASLRPADIAKVLREGYDIQRLNDGFLRLIDKLKLDILLVDTHPGLNEETLLSIAVSDVSLLIVRPDQQDFLGTAVTVDVARRLQVPNMLLILNKVLSGTDTDALRRDLEASLHADVAATFLLTTELLQLGSAGLFRLLNPHTEWSAEMNRLASKIRTVCSVSAAGGSKP
jgi:septum site-determining protein MinD